MDESRITRVTEVATFRVLARHEDDEHYARFFPTLDEALVSVENDRYFAYVITEMHTVAVIAPRAATADELAEDARIDRKNAARQESWNAVKLELGRFSYEDPIANDLFAREMEKRGYTLA